MVVHSEPAAHAGHAINRVCLGRFAEIANHALFENGIPCTSLVRRRCGD
jgi:hypothetical protein